ncbi:retrovirus-related pol polyprotein from transposon TNT 1-94 [Tanacetum coccineum]
MSQSQIATLAIRVRKNLNTFDTWTYKLKEGELTMEELPWILLAYLRISQSCLPLRMFPVEDPVHTDEEADLQRALELSLKEQAEQTQGPARPVVLREPDSGKYQPLPEVQGKGKEKVVNEQAAHGLLTLQTLKKKSLVDQFIFQRRPSMHTEPTRQAKSPSLDAEPPLTNSETESDEEVPMINAGDQDEGQA